MNFSILNKDNIKKIFFSSKLLNICYVLIILGLSSLLSFFLIGSSLDENNIVHEPFGIIATGLFLTLIGLLGVFYKICLAIFLKLFRNKK
jgi:hypothetical protein